MKTIISILSGLFVIAYTSSVRCQTAPVDSFKFATTEAFPSSTSSFSEPAAYRDDYYYEDPYRHRTEINPIVGLSFSSLYSAPPNYSSTARVGWLIGCNFRFGNRFFFQPGIDYMGINSQIQSTSNVTVNSNVQTDINVLRIPLLVGFRLFRTSDPVNLSFHAGVSADFVTSINTNNNALQSDEYNSPFWGGVIGAGLDFAFLTFDLDYDYGLSQIFEPSYQPYGSGPRSGSVIMTVGVRSPF
jgi:hypothetical protein